MVDRATPEDEACETDFVPTPTVAAPELAWSQDADLAADELIADEPTHESEHDPARESESWGVAWGNAAVFITAGLVLAFVIGIVGWVTLRGEGSPPMPARAEPPSAMETDRQFIGSLETVLGKNMPNTANAIGAAHAVCALGYTRPPPEIEALVKTDLAATDWTEGTVGYFIQTAKVSYCPQYVN